MGAATSALAVAAVGVVGTLLASLLTQWISMRNKRLEFALQRQQLADERAEAERRLSFEERRSCYVELNAVARAYRGALKTRLRMLREAPAREDFGDDLENSRNDWKDQYSRAQLVMPDHVLAHGAVVSAILAQAYGIVKRLETGDSDLALTGADGNEDFAEALEFINGRVYDVIAIMRRMMREDLGVSTPTTQQAGNRSSTSLDPEEGVNQLPDADDETAPAPSTGRR